MTPSFIHALAHRVTGFDYPRGHWWIDLLAVLAFVVAPAWTGWLIVRFGLRWAGLRRRRRARPRPMSPTAGAASEGERGWRLERFMRASRGRYARQR